MQRVERSEHGEPGEFDFLEQMTNEQLRHYILERLAGALN